MEDPEAWKSDWPPLTTAVVVCLAPICSQDVLSSNLAIESTAKVTDIGKKLHRNRSWSSQMINKRRKLMSVSRLLLSAKSSKVVRLFQDLQLRIHFLLKCHRFVRAEDRPTFKTWTAGEDLLPKEPDNESNWGAEIAGSINLWSFIIFQVTLNSH